MVYEVNLQCVEQPLVLLIRKIIRDRLYICINTQNSSNVCHVHVNGTCSFSLTTLEYMHMHIFFISQI